MTFLYEERKRDFYYAVDYLFYQTHYPFYVKKYGRHHADHRKDLESQILFGAEQTLRTR